MTHETAEDRVDAAVARSWGARRALAASEPHDRAAWLDDAADALDRASEEIVRTAAEETAIDPARLGGESVRTSRQARLFARVLREGGLRELIVDHPDADELPAPRPDLRRDLVPLGPIAVFPAGNFPLAFGVFGGDTVSALAAGNPVVVKAHPGYPRTSRRTAELVAAALGAAGAPAGALELVEGIDAGVRLIEHPHIRAVGFTGSVAGGRALQRIAQERPEPIPFFGELGSVNPAYVLPDHTESVDAIAEGFVGSLTVGDGRLCTKPGLLVVPRDSGLAEQVAARADAVELVPTLGDAIERRFQSEVARIAAAPRLDTLTAERPGHHAVVFRVTADELLERPEELLVEMFGPAALVVEYDRVDQVPEIALAAPAALAAAVFTAGSDPVAAELLAALRERVGRIVQGGWPTGVAVSWAMQHGGPFPATTAPAHTSVGVTAARRWVRPLTYQGFDPGLLPAHLRDGSGIAARIDGTPGVL